MRLNMIFILCKLTVSKIHGVTAATLSGGLVLSKRQVPDYREVVGCIRDTETGLGFFIFKLKGVINK
jgi:hypothetical protein